MPASLWQLPHLRCGAELLRVLPQGHLNRRLQQDTQVNSHPPPPAHLVWAACHPAHLGVILNPHTHLSALPDSAPASASPPCYDKVQATISFCGILVTAAMLFSSQPDQCMAPPSQQPHSCKALWLCTTSDPISYTLLIPPPALGPSFLLCLLPGPFPPSPLSYLCSKVHSLGNPS